MPRFSPLKCSMIAVLIALATASTTGAAGDIAPGAPAPGFNLPSSGGQVGLDSLKGQVVLINFWASWCGPCREEMPILEKLYLKYQPAGFTLLGVNVEPKSADAAKFLHATSVSFPILFDSDSKVSKLYQVADMPSTVILDRNGKVRYVHHGYHAGDENEYIDQIRSLTSE